MRLTRLYVRFYKSFNYDYERKSHPNSTPTDWEQIDGAWFPYVRVDLEPSITAIVGANESGKSHLLHAIDKLLTGRAIGPADFCRYSRFFSVQRGERRSPEFAGDFEICTPSDVRLVKQHLELDLQIGSRLRLLRETNRAPRILAHVDDEQSVNVAKVDEEKLQAALPTVFRIDARTPLPASIPLYELVRDAPHPYGSRRSREKLLRRLFGTKWNGESEFTQAAPELYALLTRQESSDEEGPLEKQYALARSLLLDVAGIDPTTFVDLAKAIADGREGYANGLFQRINDSLARQLNFPRWWAQDREFRLLTSPREHDIVFTIRDRTGTDYSFAERSNGLRYFLSYYVQLLAHRAPKDEHSEILLMDEPDAYLSNQGQQDLLRVLERFAQPEDGGRESQVVYVTHSPFLLNRNAAQRVRVLDKGRMDEGTRVVKDVARNHYEPLRSALGAFVAETSFIGGSNLFVEGLADQVLLAGLNSHLIARGVPKTALLDLNEVTIVPAGSAGSIPYLVYLARGRDTIRPPCVVLLDNDKAGMDAAKILARGGPRRAQLVPSENVVQIGRWVKNAAVAVDTGVMVRELEDLVPVEIAAQAARNYATRVVGLTYDQAETLNVGDVSTQLASRKGAVFDAVAHACAQRWGREFRIEKVGFAREIVALLAQSRDPSRPVVGRDDLAERFQQLLGHLGKCLKEAQRAEEERRWGNRLRRTLDSFLADHPTITTRERAKVLMDEIDAAVDDSAAGDRIKSAAAALRRDFNLEEDLTKPVGSYEEFLERVKALRYVERHAQRQLHGDGTVRPDEKDGGPGSEDPEKTAIAIGNGTSEEADTTGG